MAEAEIIVVEDEPGIREMLREYLCGHGFAVRLAENAAACRRLLGEQQADLILLDINMPGEDGLSLARWLRGQPQGNALGIIMLTAEAAVVDRVVGLEVGADDYVAKPFDLRELRARIRTVLRRVKPAGMPPQQQPQPQPGDTVRFGSRLLHLGSRKLCDAGGLEIPLTAMEFDLLKTFAAHPDRVLSRDQLLDLAHHGQWEPFDRSIDIRIARLRRKIEADPAHPVVLKTVHGAGYLFDSHASG